jgi:PAS domain S-box-containing protein
MKSGTPRRPRLTFNFSTFVALVLLSLLGLFGNYIHIELFFGVDFLFGGVAVLLAMSILGWRSGILVGAIASLYTYVLWGHPYAILIFTCEAIVVGFLFQRKHWSLASSEVGYWFTIGIPLVYYCYHGRMELPGFAAWTIALKQASNGIFCAFLVSAILLVPVVQRWITRLNRFPPRPLRNLLVELTLACTFFALLFCTSVDSTLALKQTKDSVYQQLKMVADNTLNQVHVWQQWDGNNTQLLADLIRTQQYPFDLAITLESSNSDFYVKHFSGSFSAPPLEFSTVHYIRDRLEQYFPVGKMPTMRRFRQSVYQWRVPPSSSSPWSLTITSSAEPQIAALEKLYSQQLLRLLVITGVILLFANTTASIISQPIVRLNQALAEAQSSFWTIWFTPESFVSEVNAEETDEIDFLGLNPVSEISNDYFNKQANGQSAASIKTMNGENHDDPGEMLASPNTSPTTFSNSPVSKPIPQRATPLNFGATSAILEFRNLDRYLQQWASHGQQQVKTLMRNSAELEAINQSLSNKLDDATQDMMQLERDALAARQRLIAIVQHSPIVVIEWQLDRSISAWNPAAEKLFGYASTEVLGQDLFHVILPDREAKSMLNTWQNLLDLTGGHHSTHEAMTKDGQTVVCDWFNRPVMARSGAIVSIISILQEVML